MSAFAELELQLQQVALTEETGTYVLTLRVRLPESDADIDPLKGQGAAVRLDLAALRALLHDPHAYGQQLTASLFADPAAHRAWAQAQSAAPTAPLRVRLTIAPNAPELHRLRWETLRDPQTAALLFTGERLYFSRYLPSSDWRPLRPRARDTLKALLVVANPQDLATYRLAPIDVPSEIARAQAGLADIATTVLASTTAPVTLEQLLAQLREPYDIVYLVGHGVLSQGEPWLFLENAAGQTARVAGRELAARCNELQTPPRLFVLVSCQSAGTNVGEALNALGPLLAEAGVPAVLAMQGNISMDTVAHFMPVFLAEVQRDGQIDRAVAVARGTVRAQPDAWMPVLFTRLAHGNLFHTDGDAVCPYPGLQGFTEADATHFFGREALIAELLERLRAYPGLLIVVGDSGSGKSSLVKAGVVPALRQGRLPRFNSATWPVEMFTPNTDPLRELASAVTGTEPFSLGAETLAQRLQHDPAALVDAVTQRLAQSGASRLVLVIDQFEETFTLCQDEAQRLAFIAAITAATAHNLTLLLTLRAGFYHRCAQYPALRTALEKHQTYIGAMSQMELRAAIERPLGQRWALEPSLLEVVLHDVGTEPGALPLLSHALRETWLRREGRLLTLKGYHAAGGLRQALMHSAEAVYAQLTPAQQRVAQQTFLHLTQLGDGAGNGGQPLPDTRRRMALAGQPEAVWPVLKMLADARLIITSREEIEVAHEALIREWPRLRAWLDEDRAGLRLHHQLTSAAQEWARLERDPSALYRGTRLALVLEWQTQKTPALSPLEAEFLTASQAEQAREEQAREAQRQQQLALERARVAAEAARAQEAEARATEARAAANRLRLRNRLLTGAGVLTLLLMVLVGVFALNAQTQEATAKALARQTLGLLLAAQANQVFEKFPAELNRVTLLAIESLQRYPNAEANETLGQALAVLPKPVLQIPFTSEAARFSPDGQWLAMANGATTVKVLVVATGAEVAQMTHADQVSSVDFSADGQWVASGSWDGAVLIWEAATGREVARVTHASLVTDVDFSPDGQWLASVDLEGVVRVWSTATRQEVNHFTQGTEAMTLVFSPDSQWLLAGNTDGTARVFAVATGEEIARVTHKEIVASAAFSPNGQQVVSSSMDGTVKVWAAATGKEMAHVIHEGAVTSAAFSPDGQQVVSGGWDGTVSVWAVATGQEVLHIAPGDLVMLVAYSPDGQWVAVGRGNGVAQVFAVATGRELARVSHEGGVPLLAFSPDGKRLVSGGAIGQAQIWEPQMAGRGTAQMTVEGMINHAAFSPDGQWVVSSDVAGTARVWEAATGREVARMTHADHVTSVAFSPDGQWVVSGSYDSSARVWEAATGREVARLTHDMAVSALAFSPDGRWVVSGSWDGTTRVWEAATGREVARLMADWVNTVAFSPDGQWVVSGGDDDIVHVWEAATGREVARMLHEDSVTSVGFSPDGQWVVSGSNDSTARVWEVATGREVARMLHADAVGQVVFSPNGQWVASGSGDGTARVWEAATGREVARTTHEDRIYAVAFSADGQWLVSASADSTARVLAVATGQEVARIVLEDWVTAIAFSPDGTRLASGSADNAVRVWLWQAQALMALACERVGRNLTQAEWHQYFPASEPYHTTCAQWPGGE